MAAHLHTGVVDLLGWRCDTKKFSNALKLFYSKAAQLRTGVVPY
jgi:hypothetical protein